jgi:hypothetical protein
MSAPVRVDDRFVETLTGYADVALLHHGPSLTMLRAAGSV